MTAPLLPLQLWQAPYPARSQAEFYAELQRLRSCANGIVRQVMLIA